MLYTDHFLARTIEYLRGMSDTRSALLYCADHGEDLIDDERERFLHASPPPRPGSSMWRAGVVFGCLPPRIPGKAEAALRNAAAPATTHAMFHTHDGRHRLDKGEESIFHLGVARERRFRLRYGARCYLNDHNEAVPFAETGLTQADVELLHRSGVEI